MFGLWLRPTKRYKHEQINHKNWIVFVWNSINNQNMSMSATWTWPAALCLSTPGSAPYTTPLMRRLPCWAPLNNIKLNFYFLYELYYFFNWGVRVLASKDWTIWLVPSATPIQVSTLVYSHQLINLSPYYIGQKQKEKILLFNFYINYVYKLE